MYNRYVRSDDGRYERIPTPDPPPREETPPPPPETSCPPRQDSWQDPPPDNRCSAPPPPQGQKQGLLSELLGKLGVENIDTGDLLLLILLFLLFRDGEDEELLIALGLLLIL